jgi:hypothetical protein
MNTQATGDVKNHSAGYQEAADVNAWAGSEGKDQVAPSYRAS